MTVQPLIAIGAIVGGFLVWQSLQEEEEEVYCDTHTCAEGRLVDDAYETLCLSNVCDDATCCQTPGEEKSETLDEYWTVSLVQDIASFCPEGHVRVFDESTWGNCEPIADIPANSTISSYAYKVIVETVGEWSANPDEQRMVQAASPLNGDQNVFYNYIAAVELYDAIIADITAVHEGDTNDNLIKLWENWIPGSTTIAVDGRCFECATQNNTECTDILESENGAKVPYDLTDCSALVTEKDCCLEASQYWEDITMESVLSNPQIWWTAEEPEAIAAEMIINPFYAPAGQPSGTGYKNR